MKTLLIAFAALVSASCSHTPIETAERPAQVQASEYRHPASGVQRPYVLPDQARWASLYDYADNLDLTKVGLEMHAGGGTSVYGVVMNDGKPVGALIPNGNSSGSVSGETIAFTLSRALGVSEIYQTAVYKKLTGANLEAFMKIIPSTPIMLKGKVNAPKEYNRQTILRNYAKDPSQLGTVFKRWDAKPRDIEGISDDSLTLSKKYRPPGASAPMAALVSCDGPKPSASHTVTFAGGTNDELTLAKQMSAILLIDAMTQQRDRFTGGNFQSVTKDGHVNYASIDNGGTWGGISPNSKAKGDPDVWITRNLKSVTRFEKSVAEEILGISALLTRREPYHGLRNENELYAALDITEASNDVKARFKRATLQTATWINQHPNCYF